MQGINRVAAISLFLLLPATFALSSSPQSGKANSPQDPLVTAIEMNFSAINLAKLAQTRTANPDVKEFADAMVKDHTRVLTQLRKESGAPDSEVRVSMPHQVAADRLSKLSGPEFDREFARQTVADYQDTVNFLEIRSMETDSDFAKTAYDLKTRAVEDLLEAENLRQTLAVGTTVPGKGNVYSDRGTAPAPPSPAAPPAAPPSSNGGGPIP